MITSNSCRVCNGRKMVVCGVWNAYQPFFEGVAEARLIEMPPKLASEKGNHEQAVKVWCGECGIMYHPGSV